MLSAKLSRMLSLPAVLLTQACIGQIGAGGDINNEALESDDALPTKATSPDELATPEEPAGSEKEAGTAVDEPALTPSRNCEDMTDAEVLAAVYGGPKVPPGYYAEAAEENAWAVWGSACAPSLDAARKSALSEAEESAGVLSGAERTTPYFHEVDITISGGLYTIHYRETRCDYFNGTKLAGAADADALGELAVYLWYTSWANTSGYNALAGVPREDKATGERTFMLCEAQTAYGDCGLCDEVVLMQSQYKLASDGTVTRPEAPQPIRLIQGHCDN